MISIGHEFLNTQNKNYSRNIIHYRITRIVKEIYMGIKGKQKIKIIKNAYGKKFHRLENPRISFYQKKGKVDSPYSLLERICDCLNLGASILILCLDLKVWIAHQSIWISWSGSEGLQRGNAKEVCNDEWGSAEWEVGDNDPASAEKAFCLALGKWPTIHKNKFWKGF